MYRPHRSRRHDSPARPPGQVVIIHPPDPQNERDQDVPVCDGL